jgi:transglutaminase-like putative cysteine protease
VYGLVAMAGLMLAFAEESPFPEILTPAIALVAYVLTDRLRTVHLPILWANTLGVVVFVASGWQMRNQTLDQRVVVAAHLLVYLSWIVLFQKKNLTQYWWMCALAVLQVAVGSILTIATSYGGLLVGFMFAAIWTLSLMSLYDAYLQYEAGSGDFAGPASITARTTRGWRARHKADSQLARSLWAQPSAARGTIQLDPDQRWLGLRYMRSILGIGIAALVVAAGFFLFIPRLWAGRTEWGNAETRKARAVGLTGFSNEVRLGDMVPLLENSKRVLQVSLFNPNAEQIDLERYCAQVGYAEPLFRGATLETYENGTWSGSGHVTTWLPERRSGTPRSIRQQYLMEPIGTSLLFAIHPIEGIRLPSSQDPAQIIPISRQIFRPETVPADKPLSYEVFSPPAEIAATKFRLVHKIDISEEQLAEEFLSIPDAKLSRLKEIAKKVTGGEHLTMYSSFEKSQDLAPRLIEKLSEYLRDSGEFVYSLDASVKDPKLDPVEDFLINRKAGHCEYFASALGLMLRSVGVPARLVTGFKGGTVNAISGQYEVEQRHAHVWVEALVGGDRWITVDPTPAARDASVASFAAPVKTVHELASVMNSTWTRLMNMNINEQQTSFYAPIRDAVQQWWTGTNGQRPFLAQLINGIVDFATDPTQWFTLKGIAVAVIIGVILAGTTLLVRMRKRLWARLIGLWKRQGSAREIRIAFYARFESLCQQLGLVRASNQTQREFAGTVGPRIRQVVASADGLPDLPPRLVEFFYRVRFGDEDLAPAVVAQIDSDLTSLEHALRESRRHPNGHA